MSKLTDKQIEDAINELFEKLPKDTLLDKDKIIAYAKKSNKMQDKRTYPEGRGDDCKG